MKPKVSLIVAAGVLAAVIGTVLITRSCDKPKPQQPVQVVQSAPGPVTVNQPGPTDWVKCVDTTAAPDNLETHLWVEVTHRNHCPVTLDAFNVLFKLYDSSDARIGWADENIGALDPGEKVKYRLKYPVDNFPLTKANGVARVQVFQFDKEQPKN